MTMLIDRGAIAGMMRHIARSGRQGVLARLRLNVDQLLELAEPAVDCYNRYRYDTCIYCSNPLQAGEVCNFFYCFRSFAPYCYTGLGTEVD